MEQNVKSRGRVRGALAVLLLAVVLTFPYALNPTWSLPGEEAERTLTYTTGKLTWDSSAAIDKDGAIRLSMFRPEYTNVASGDGGNVVAPGTDNHTKIRLRNAGGNPISYKAVLYRLDETQVPLAARLTGAEPTVSYGLPAGVENDQVIQAVGGELKGSSVKVLDIDWLWDFEGGPEEDRADTALGNKELLDQVKYGLYIVVTDNYTGTSMSPKTGDDAPVVLCLILCAASMWGIVALTAWDFLQKRRHDKKKQ